ncbi:ribulose-phosphate 3-epimerase, partial [candidate division WOR-3 bacterium]
LLVMSVEPGFAGQGFITGSLDRIRRARQWIDETGVGCILAVDGGVKVENAPMIASSGADLLVAASAIFKARDYCQVIERLRCSKP